MYFSDLETKDFIPLCARPDCRHDNANCSAYTGAATFTVFGNHIYYVDGYAYGYDPDDSSFDFPSLWRMNLDGTAHEELMKMPFPNPDFAPSNGLFATVFTNKYAFVHSFFSDEMKYTCENYVIDLETLDTSTVSSPWLNFDYRGGLYAMAGRGDMLYLFISEYTDDLSRSVITNHLCALNCATAQLSRIGELPEDVYYSGFDYYLADDDIYYICRDPIEQDPRLCKSSLTNGKCTELWHGLYSDIGWPWLEWQNGLLFKENRAPDSSLRQSIYFEDLNLNEAEYHFYSEKELDEAGRLMCFFQTESYIFGIGPDRIGAYSAQNGIPEWYIDKVDIGTGNLMWRRWAPEG